MNNIINRMMIGTSLIGLTFSLGLGNAYATDQLCAVVPTCEELGYTDTSCPEGSDPIKCPLDLTKLHCGSSNTSTASCEELGYVHTWCDYGGGYVALKCPFDQTKLYCTLNGRRCKTGDILYDDLTCSHDRNPAKTPIAIMCTDYYFLALHDISGTLKDCYDTVAYGVRWGAAGTGDGYTSQCVTGYDVQEALVRAGGDQLSGTYVYQYYTYTGSPTYYLSYTYSGTSEPVFRQTTNNPTSKSRCTGRLN